MSMQALKLLLNTSLLILREAVSPFQTTPPESFLTLQSIKEQVPLLTTGCAIVCLYYSLYCVKQVIIMSQNINILPLFFHLFVQFFMASRPVLLGPNSLPKQDITSLRCVSQHCFTFILRLLGLINRTNLIVIHLQTKVLTNYKLK